MSNRNLAILLTLFFGGLLAVWLSARGPGRVDPGSDSKVSPVLRLSAPVDRIEIDGDPSGRIVLQRHEAGRWERVSPTRGEAPTGRVERMLGHLASLRPVTESGTLDGPASRFGLEPPRRVLRLSGPNQPEIVLEVGAVTAGTAYVRTPGGPIHAVEANRLAFVEGDAAAWRERRLLPVMPAEVRAVTIAREGQTLRAERAADGHWRLVQPVQAPADAAVIGTMLTSLVSATTGDPVESASGLETPWLRVTLETRSGGERSVAVGGEVPGRAGQYAAQRDGDAEVVAVPLRVLDGLSTAPESLRSRRALVFRPDRVQALAVVEGDREHLLIREDANTWRLERPDRAPADAKVVSDLIKTLSELDAAAVLAPRAMPDSGVDRPQATVKLWLSEPGKPGEVPKADDPGDLSLAVGRRDAGRKQSYVRTGGDTSILAVVESFPTTIPRGDMAFRDRSVQAIELGRIARIEVEQGGQTDVIVAGPTPGDYHSWRMEQPVAGRVDAKSVAALDLLLSRLRASSLVETGPGTIDLARFGLDQPVVRVSWTLRPDSGGNEADGGTLRVGSAVSSGDDRRFASLAGRSGVFTIDPKALAILTAELHERTVLSYPPEEVSRLTLRWPGRPEWVIERRPKPFEGVAWVTVSGTAPRGLPVADLAPMAARLALLVTERFAQYGGPHRPEFGLGKPAMSVEVTLSGALGTRLLRIGARGPSGSRFAAAGTGDTGPVFYVPEEPWAPWLNPPDVTPATPPAPALPARVFAPED